MGNMIDTFRNAGGILYKNDNRLYDVPDTIEGELEELFTEPGFKQCRQLVPDPKASPLQPELWAKSRPCMTMQDTYWRLVLQNKGRLSSEFMKEAKPHAFDYIHKWDTFAFEAYSNRCMRTMMNLKDVFRTVESKTDVKKTDTSRTEEAKDKEAAAILKEKQAPPL